MAQWRSAAAAASVLAPACVHSAPFDNRPSDWANTVDMVPCSMEIDMVDSKCPEDVDHMVCNRMADMVNSALDADSGPMVSALPEPMAGLAAAVSGQSVDSGMCAGNVAVRRRL